MKTNVKSSFKEAASLHQIILNGVSRDLPNGQILEEAKHAGFVSCFSVNNEMISWYRDGLNAMIELEPIKAGGSSLDKKSSDVEFLGNLKEIDPKILFSSWVFQGRRYFTEDDAQIKRLKANEIEIQKLTIIEIGALPFNEKIEFLKSYSRNTKMFSDQKKASIEEFVNSIL